MCFLVNSRYVFRWICNPPAKSIGIYNALIRIKDPDIQCIGIANPDEPYIKGNASFERPELPTHGVGKWPMCTHSAHLAPLTSSCIRWMSLAAMGCPLFHPPFPTCEAPGRGRFSCNTPRMKCIGLYARLPFGCATPHPEPRMPWHVPEGTSSGLTGWPAGRTG